MDPMAEESGICVKSFDRCTAEADVIIDFSHHALTKELTAFAVKRGLPLVLATTGQTEEEKDALEEIRKLAPGVAAKMTELLNNPRVPAIAKVRILEIILERTYGKPETAVRLNADMPLS